MRIIYQRNYLRRRNLLLMILQFYRWFSTQVLHHYRFLMRTFPKCRNRCTNGRYHVILKPLNKPKKLFFPELNSSNHGDIYFNNMLSKRKNTQKHLEKYLDVKLDCSEHIYENMKKEVHGNSVIKKINVILPRSSLLTIYKSFIRPYLRSFP